MRRATSRRSFLTWLGLGLSATACAPSSSATTLRAPTATLAAPSPLPIEQQLNDRPHLPVEDFGTAQIDEGGLRQPAQLSGEAAAESVIPIVVNRAPVLRRRSPPKRIMIPRIGVDAKVVDLGTRLDGTGTLVWETAAFAVGHHRGTANPGEQGNMVLSGHISSRSEGDVFRRLPEIEPGDGVVVVTDEQPFLYAIDDKQTVEPHEVRVMDAGTRSVCTLITCVPDGVYTHRLVVSGALV